MSGTKAGFEKARLTMIDRKFGGSVEAYNLWVKEKGSKGGLASNTGGFASDIVGDDGLTGLERARVVGAIGGSLSKRKPVAK